MVQKVYISNPRGFCAGVEMAIKALSFLVKAFKGPIYCYHEIVHNQIVVERFRKQGVVFVDSIDEVPQDGIVMLSAHGSAPEVVDKSKAFNRISVNAVCPLVTKVHHEAKTRAKKGFEIIYVGHVGHDEAIGTMAVAPDHIHLVGSKESLEEAKTKIDPNSDVALLAQTTLAVSEWKDLEENARELYPEIWTASKNDLCFATTNRQSALKELVKLSNVILIIGSANSSNTLALEKVASEEGCERVVRIDSADALDDIELFEEDIVGITAGASAPEDIVQEVIEKCGSRTDVEEVRPVDEQEYFPPPSHLRDLAIDLNSAMEEIFIARRKELGLDVVSKDFSELKSVFNQDRKTLASASIE